MADPTPAQQEFNDLVANNARDDLDKYHPEDRDTEREERDGYDTDEEDAHRIAQIDSVMRTNTVDNTRLRLPPASFDAGRTTGVKGVIADARNYEEARKASFLTRAKDSVRKSFLGMPTTAHRKTDSDSDDASAGAYDSQDDDDFMQRWRETRKREMEIGASTTVRNRRTSPSVRVFGRLDEVDALGYLDAIEKVNREQVVVVFVADFTSEVCSAVEEALLPLVTEFSTIHFVKVHCVDIDFDDAAAPTILAYKNQGELFANLTSVVDLLPWDKELSTETLRELLEEKNVL